MEEYYQTLRNPIVCCFITVGVENPDIFLDIDSTGAVGWLRSLEGF
jgi:hypothetical protein